MSRSDGAPQLTCRSDPFEDRWMNHCPLEARYTAMSARLLPAYHRFGDTVVYEVPISLSD